MTGILYAFSLSVGCCGSYWYHCIRITTELFSIEPQMGIDEGKVLVLKRTPKMDFIDSPRGYCQRQYPTEESSRCGSRILPALLESTHVFYELPFSTYFYDMTYQTNDEYLP